MKVIDKRLSNPLQDNTLEECYIFDLDGTLALINGRSPYDGKSCATDVCNEDLASLLRTLYLNYKIFIFSGRNGNSAEKTVEWLGKNDIPFHILDMRKDGDNRKDTVVKQEMYEFHIKDKYYVRGIFDDRDMMVKHWRDMGLPCYQVYYGDF